MKEIGKIRSELSWIHTFRLMAIEAVDMRDSIMLRNKLKSIERKIAVIRYILDHQEETEEK